MAKKKQARKSNKKKSGGGNNGAKSRVASSSPTVTDPSALLKGEIPDFGSIEPITKRNYSSIYSCYKSATHRFLQYMRDNVPKNLIDGDTSVNFLLTAADWMSSQSHVLDPYVMRDLKLCIRMRNRVAKSMFGGGDDGHKYFLQVLVYCWTVLRILPTAEKKIEDDTVEDGEIVVDENRFSPLLNEEEEEDVEDDTDCFPVKVSRPEPKANPVTFEELLASDDRNDAVLFLLSLDELMEFTAGQYSIMARNIRKDVSRGYKDTTMISTLMDAAISANFSIQAVQKMEMELQTQHEHLTTPCRLLACLEFPEITAQVSSIVGERGAKPCGRSEIIAFLGDSMECSFINPSDEWNRKDSIVGEFCRKYEVDDTGSAQIEELFVCISQMTILEIPMKPEVTTSLNQFRATLERETGKPHKSHSWLPQMDFVGGDRSIHRTVRLMQLFAGAIDKSRAQGRTLGPANKGMFGTLTDRPSKFSDMDELLMSHLLPHWANLCRYGILGKVELPRISELSPLYVQLKSFVENPRRSVSWSCAFSVHAVLTGIFEVAAERQHVTDLSKHVFDTYFAQVKHTLKVMNNEKSSNMKKSKAMHNIAMVSFLENFGLSALGDKAMWNPLCAGTNLSILDFFGNLEGGCAVIDCQAQLRIMMYLYHGLIINGIMEEDSVPFLQRLYEGFKDCKALWQGSLPSRGELVKKFWISFGMGLSHSKRMSEYARRLARGGPVSPAGVFAEGLQHYGRGRTMKPIEPSEISTAFRRICERDFEDVIDKYHTPEQRKRSSHTEQYVVAVRVNDVLDHLEEEMKLHSVNFISAAYHLEQFVCSITRVLQWDSLLETFNQTTNLDTRQGFAIIFAQHLLGALDFAHDPLNYQFRNAPMLTRQAPTLFHGLCGFLDMYFSRVPPENVLWFQAMAPADDGKTELIGSGAKRR